MIKRVERGLQVGNIGACATAVGSAAAEVAVPGLGVARAGIAGALASIGLFKDLTVPEQDWARDLARSIDEALAGSHLTEARKTTFLQMLPKNLPGLTDIAEGNRDAAAIANALWTRAEGAAETGDADPAHGTLTALTDFEDILRAALTAFLMPKTEQDAANAELLQRTQKLLDLAEQQGRADALRDEGITEKAIIRLAQRISASTEHLGQAWLDLQNAMDIAVRVQAEGQGGSNHGDFVDTVLARVAELSRDGAYAKAGDEIEAALAEQQAKTLRLFDSGVEVALLDGDTARAADLLIRKAEAEGKASFEELRALQEQYYVEGRDKGLAQPLRLSIDLARRVQVRATSPDERGTALNDLGAALQTLGARESGTARLEEAVVAYRAALEERTRDRVPLDWAGTQMNLGAALRTLGARESGTARLQEAVAAYRAALEERTRDRVPLDWATVQMNLGNALKTLGQRESGTARLQEAVAAYRAALEERTRDRVPLDWATLQFNLATLEMAFFDKTGSAAHLDLAEEFVQAARAVFEEGGATQYIAMADRQLARIDAARAGLGGA